MNYFSIGVLIFTAAVLYGIGLWMKHNDQDDQLTISHKKERHG